MKDLIYSLDDLNEVAEKIISFDKNNKVFLFEGDLGAGKTTLIKAICNHLGVQEEVSSPTFSIINEYTSANNDAVFHFDCYRLKTINEAIDIGAEDYLYSGNYCFIEWPKIIEPILPESFIKLELNLSGSKRSITLNRITDVRK